MGSVAFGAVVAVEFASGVDAAPQVVDSGVSAFGHHLAAIVEVEPQPVFGQRQLAGG